MKLREEGKIGSQDLGQNKGQAFAFDVLSI